jgi:hypothetical protein
MTARAVSHAGRKALSVLRQWSLAVQVFVLDVFASPRLDNWWWARRLRQIGPGLEVAYEHDERMAVVRCRLCGQRWVVDLLSYDPDAWCDCFKNAANR